MDVHSLKKYLIKNEEKVLLLLEDVGFSHVNDDFKGGLEIRCAWEDGGNPTSVRIIKDTLSSTCFSRNVNGDIVTLIQARTGLTFPRTIERIAHVTGFKESANTTIKQPFGGFYKKIRKSSLLADTIETAIYDESILNDYLITPSERFLKDGINYDVQVKYQIGYDWQSNRIIVPWRNFKGDLIGIMGRLNKDEIESYENKWFPIIAFPKSATLFGFIQNYHHIQREKFLFIEESEKSPMVLESKGINLGLGLGGNNISKVQANNIKSMFPERIIVGMDEGLDVEKSVNIAEAVKMDKYFKNEVYYIHDKHNIYLPKGSKMSPSDLPKEDMKRLMVHCMKKI